MKRLNIIGFETAFGYRTIELLHGDLAALDPAVDVLVASAFAGSYHATPGSVFGALYEQHAIDAVALSRDAELDLRNALGVWLSGPLSSGPAKRLLCVDMIGGSLPLAEALDNVFASLLLAEAKGVEVRTVALPLLGAGYQGLKAETLSMHLVERAMRFLERAASATSLQFVEIDEMRANAVSESMDSILGRVRVDVPQEVLTKALLADVRNKLARAETLFNGDGRALRDDWLRLLNEKSIRSVEFGVLARKLVELLLNRSNVPQQVLANRIRAFEAQKSVAPWICGYMHVLRHLGNESAHENCSRSEQIPAAVTPPDLTAGLICIERLLDFSAQQRPRAAE